MTPAGWKAFLTLLQEHNIPKSILNRQTLDEIENRATPKTGYVAIKKEEEVKPKLKRLQGRASSPGPKTKRFRSRAPTRNRSSSQSPATSRPRRNPSRKAKPNPDFLAHFE